MLQAYRDHVAERAKLGIPPLPLTAKQTGDLIVTTDVVIPHDLTDAQRAAIEAFQRATEEAGQ